MGIMEKHRLDVMEENIQELISFNHQVLKGQSIDHDIVVDLNRKITKLEYQIKQMQEQVNLLIKIID